MRLDDEVQFIRSWIEGRCVPARLCPQAKSLARTMAGTWTDAEGPVVELGPGTGPVTAALVEHGVHPSRLVLVEFDPDFCRLLRKRYPEATVVQGDAYRLRHVLATYFTQPAAAIVSSLPLLTRPPHPPAPDGGCGRIAEAGAPFVQFTYGLSRPFRRHSPASQPKPPI